MDKLVIRADASTQMGTGHVMRCLALAQAWQGAGGKALFVMAMEVPVLDSRLQSEGMGVIPLSAQPGSADDATQTADFACQIGARWIVVDGYHFSAKYQRIIKDEGLRLLFIDDGRLDDHYYADIVLNQNLHAKEDFYMYREPYTRLLLGTSYVLLRREFLKWRGWKREITDVAQKVLVTLGGSDPENVTLKVIRALEYIKRDGLEAIVVAGGSNPHYEKLQSAVRESRLTINVVSNVSNTPELMSWADVAISSGGTTVWELAFMGVPSIVGVIAPIEEFLLSGLEKKGLFFHLGWFKQLSTQQLAETVSGYLCDKKMRKHMSLLGQQIVGGCGCDRVLNAMMDRLRV